MVDVWTPNTIATVVDVVYNSVDAENCLYILYLRWKLYNKNKYFMKNIYTLFRCCAFLFRFIRSQSFVFFCCRFLFLVFFILFCVEWILLCCLCVFVGCWYARIPCQFRLEFFMNRTWRQNIYTHHTLAAKTISNTNRSST